MRLSLPSSRCCNRHPRGGIYIMVLGVSMIVTVIGVSSLLAVRVQGRVGEGANDAIKAKFYAESAVDVALLKISNDANWRNTYTHDLWVPEQAIGAGWFKWKLVDELDGVLDDDSTDPVKLTAWGVADQGIQKLSVRLEPPPTGPLDVLGTAIHCGGELWIMAGRTLTVTGAPASTNDRFRNDGALDGRIDAGNATGGGRITGVVNIPAPAKALPPSGIFDRYIAKGTRLVFSGDFNGDVLTPNLNQYGGNLNPSGVYYIKTHGADLSIVDSRIHGTLIVDTGGGKVVVDQQVFMRNYRQDYPVLMVRGHLELLQTSRGSNLQRYLREVGWGHNFNPAGAPFRSQIDTDQLDKYPSEIQGLVHCTGTLLIRQSALVHGAIICEDATTIDGNPQVIHDAGLLTNPPEGYTQGGSSQLIPVPGTWHQVVD